MYNHFMESLSEKIRVGTSGFYYPHWKEVFYPAELSKSRYFEYYMKEFDTVELNSTFYHLPKAKTVTHWEEETPEHFLFALKASRQITHYHKLKDVKDPLYLFLHLVKPLKRKIAAILFQLPPSLHKDTELLSDFLQLLPSGYRYAIEFRHESWQDEKTDTILKAYNVARCLHDFNKVKIDPQMTADFTYLRLHGPDGHYGGSYDDTTLKTYAQMLMEMAHRQKHLFVYFNNDTERNAVTDAQRLRRFVKALDPFL